MVKVQRTVRAMVTTVVPVVAFSLAAPGVATAQSKEAQANVGEFDVVMHGPGMPNMDFMTMPIGMAGETVEGAPYSADAVTEVVQPLADGNRIVRESRVSVYRDSAGRTRREQGIAVLGSLVGPGDVSLIQIHDPVSGASYILDNKSRTAHKIAVPRIVLAKGGEGIDVGAATAGVRVQSWEMAVPAPSAEGQQTMMFRGTRTATATTAPVVERLGRQSIEGVEVEGTRSTVTLPAGQIGNEQPIAIVSERWYSSELKALVLSRQSDPRFGETTYRLTNIVRAEPSPDLFQPPADYKVVEPGAGGTMMKFERQERVR